MVTLGTPSIESRDILKTHVLALNVISAILILLIKATVSDSSLEPLIRNTTLHMARLITTDRFKRAPRNVQMWLQPTAIAAFASTW